jgi:hypothetical protein
MNALNQIAQHLKIEASRIIRCEEWATCWFVVVAGKGARFVSKSVIKLTVMELLDKKTGSRVWGIVTKLGGCFNVYKTHKAAENALNKLTPWHVEYWANSVSGSLMKSIYTGQYRAIDLTAKA